jgi:hypothetical protein
VLLLLLGPLDELLLQTGPARPIGQRRSHSAYVLGAAATSRRHGSAGGAHAGTVSGRSLPLCCSPLLFCCGWWWERQAGTGAR